MIEPIRQYYQHLLDGRRGKRGTVVYFSVKIGNIDYTKADELMAKFLKENPDWSAKPTTELPRPNLGIETNR